MTTKEKAEDLIKSFVPYADVDKEGDAKWYAKKCAIICVEQIIPEVTLGVYRENRNHLMQEDYWKEVLNHLKSEQP